MIQVDINTVPDFYKRYVEHVKHLDLFEALRHSSRETLSLVRSIPESKGEFRYAPGKWSIKEVLCHMLDTERILAYRALRFARNDSTPLEGFDENDYAPEANANERKIEKIADQMERLRQTTHDLFEDMTPTMLQRKGLANKVEFSVVSLAFIIPGHESHHRQVLRERYLTALS